MSQENKACNHVFTDDDNQCLKCRVSVDLIAAIHAVNCLKEALRGVRMYLSECSHTSVTPNSDKIAVQLIDEALEKVKWAMIT